MESEMEPEMEFETNSEMTSFEAALEKAALEEPAPLEERKILLSRIMRGFIPTQHARICDGRIELIELPPRLGERLRAMAELCKLDGSYAAGKFIPEKETEPVQFIVNLGIEKKNREKEERG